MIYRVLVAYFQKKDDENGRKHFKARLRAKGQLTLPQKIQEILRAEKGDEVVFWVNEQNQVVIKCSPNIPTDQAWFWTERWQQMEQEVDEDIRAGRVVQFSTVEEAIAYLDQVTDDDINEATKKV